MSTATDALALIEREIEEAKEAGRPDKLQGLYLKRERLQEREFKASLARRARLNRERK